MALAQRADPEPGGAELHDFTSRGAGADRVDGVPRFGQFMAEWDKSDPRVVNVYVFGGRIVRCEAVNQTTGVRVTLRRLPISEMRDPEGWNPATTARFDHEPDNCGGQPAEVRKIG